MKRGFTFIELLITLAIIAICFLPLMRMFSGGLDQVHELSESSTARYLAQSGMEQLKNLGFTQVQLSELGDTWEPALEDPAFLINGKMWRVERKVIRGTDPLEIHIRVYQVSDKAQNPYALKPAVDLVLLTEDLDWSYTP